MSWLSKAPTAKRAFLTDPRHEHSRGFVKERARLAITVSRDVVVVVEPMKFRIWRSVLLQKLARPFSLPKTRKRRIDQRCAVTASAATMM